MLFVVMCIYLYNLNEQNICADFIDHSPLSP